MEDTDGMKIYSNYSGVANMVQEQDGGYRPEPFNTEEVHQILDAVEDSILEMYGRRYKKLDINIYDIHFSEESMSSKIVLENNRRFLVSKVFTFTPYSDYFDLSDYQQHLDTSIYKFVKDLFK